MIIFTFIFVGLLSRNYLFNVFKATKTFLGFNTKLNQKNFVVKNVLKVLGLQNTFLTKSRLSLVIKNFKEKFLL